MACCQHHQPNSGPASAHEASSLALSLPLSLSLSPIRRDADAAVSTVSKLKTFTGAEVEEEDKSGRRARSSFITVPLSSHSDQAVTDTARIDDLNLIQSIPKGKGYSIL